MDIPRIALGTALLVGTFFAIARSNAEQPLVVQDHAQLSTAQPLAATPPDQTLSVNDPTVDFADVRGMPVEMLDRDGDGFVSKTEMAALLEEENARVAVAWNGPATPIAR